MKIYQDDPIGRMIYLTAISLKNYVEIRLKPYDLTAEQFHVLKSLSEVVGVPQNRIGEEVAKSPANITRILDRLEKKNHIERRPNPDDRRSSLVFLTPVGNALLGKVKDHLADCDGGVLAGLDGQQQDTMRQGLQIIFANIERMLGEEEQ